jgi:hypothetical protein
MLDVGRADEAAQQLLHQRLAGQMVTMPPRTERASGSFPCAEFLPPAADNAAQAPSMTPALLLVGGSDGSTWIIVVAIVVLAPIAVGLVWRLVDRLRDR